jgi:DNA-directed RNA polymerase I, II, and III subunit RPABC1
MLVSKLHAMASFDYIDALYRSRLTLMKILTLRGYEVSAYSRFSPKEIEAMSPVIASAGFMVSHTSDEKRKCVVLYHIGKVGARMDIPKILADNNGIQQENLEHTEVIIMTNDNLTDSVRKLVMDMWGANKLSVSVFNIYQFINNPMEHVLVPKHERVTADEEAEVMKLVQSKAQLPVIKFHSDPIARCLGLTPGEIVKITRPSPSAGVYVVYRVCTA